MTNRSGAYYETRVVAYLAGVYPHMARTRTHGRFDRGEFTGTGNWTLECKNTKEIRLSEALNQAEQERLHNGTPWCAAIINRKSHGIGKSYVVMTLDQFARMLANTEGLA